MPLPKPPPQPVEQSVKVRRGEAVTIPLKIYGSQREPLRFLIRKEPAAGKLSELKQHGKESAIVQYEPPVDLEVTKDLFTYAVRNSAGVSAAVEVAIEIVDEPPMLGFPDTVSFPATLAGERAMKEIEIENRGGGMAEGELTADAPWKIEGPADYRLGAGERRSVMLVFSPESGGMARGEIRFSSDKSRTVALRGEALAPVAVEPASVRLQPQPGDPVRVGVFALKNNTDAVQKVAFVPNAKLQLKPSLELSPNGAAQVTVFTSAGAVGAISETLEGRVGDAVLRVEVSAPAAAAILRAETGEVRIAAQGAAASVVVQNVGGAEGYWKWEAEAPFVPAEPDFRLAPGERKELRLGLAQGASGNQRTLLRIVGEGHTVQIAAEANLMQAAAAPQPAPKPSAGQAHRSGSSPSRLRKTASEPRQGPLAPARAPGQVAVDKVEREQIVLSWPAKPGVEYRVEERSFAFKGNDKEIIPQWKETPFTSIRQEGGRAIAELKRLKPGQLYVLRVVDTANPELDRAALQVVTASSDGLRIFTPRRLLLVALLGMLGALLWRRRRG